MKKLIFILSMVFVSITSFGQKTWDKSNCEKCGEKPFTFDKGVIAKLEKHVSFSESEYLDTEEKRKQYLGALIIADDTANILGGKYVRLLNIPVTEKFILVSEARFNDDLIDLPSWQRSKDKEYTLIQNVKTKLYYVLNSSAFKYRDYSSSYTDGYKDLIKSCPKVLTAKEQELMNRYRTLIKSADQNIVVLSSIQKKYLTRGYFDAERVNSSDKITYNKNLDALKAKAEKLTDIDRYEDKNQEAQYRLTTSELASLMNIQSWYSNQYKLN